MSLADFSTNQHRFILNDRSPDIIIIIITITTIPHVNEINESFYYFSAWIPGRTR